MATASNNKRRSDYHNRIKPLCPHCDEEFDVWEGDTPLTLDFDDGGHTTAVCRSCSKAFVLVTSITYRFSSAANADCASEEQWGPATGEEVL